MAGAGGGAGADLGDVVGPWEYAVGELFSCGAVPPAGAGRVGADRAGAGGVPEVGVSSGIRNAIRELRAAKGMTQQELADLIRVTRQTVNAIEGDKYSPSLEVAFRIAGVFGVSVEKVFWWEGSKGK